MFLIIRKGEPVCDMETEEFFGPFPTEERANEYGNSFEHDTKFLIVPLIVPNCVQVKLMY